MFKLGRALTMALVSAFSVVGIVIGAGVANASAAIPEQQIGPDQVFSAQVNDSSGYPQPVEIKVSCPSPVAFLGETGHPLPGQTVEVTQAQTTAGGNVGFTGAFATEIGAFFGSVQPFAASGALVYVPITAYDVAVPIPTDLTVPCFGSSQVTFVPLPQDPGVSRDAVVPVEYIATCPSRVCPV